VNAAQLIGMHFGPYPHSQIRPVLEEKNIFKALKDLGADVYFANAFPRQFFEYIGSGHHKLSATTMSCMMSGVPLCDADSLRNGEGLSADITAERWATELSYSDVTPVSAFDAGKRLRRIAEKHDFTMFEYFLTDKAGHEMNKNMAKTVLETFDDLLGGIVEGGLENLTILISSDHGNVEDLSTKTHTLNPALTAVAGEHAEFFEDRLESICDITPRIVELFGSGIIR
jgi:2,3-bisphosphoglycerate-independent phosphoglycerate mutase